MTSTLRSAAVVQIAFLVACGGNPAPTPSPRVSTPDARCAGILSDKDLTSWREEAAAGFRICVPPHWSVGKRRDSIATFTGSWETGNGWLEWGVGPFKPGGKEGLVAVPYNRTEYDSISVNGRPLRRLSLIVIDRYSLFANFDQFGTLPKTRFTGYAVGRKAWDEQRTAIRTVRFDSLPYPGS